LNRFAKGALTVLGGAVAAETLRRLLLSGDAGDKGFCERAVARIVERLRAVAGTSRPVAVARQMTEYSRRRVRFSRPSCASRNLSNFPSKLSTIVSMRTRRSPSVISVI
jgi:hypothetical protein